MPGFSAADLNAAANKLHHSEPSSDSKNGAKTSHDGEALNALEELYEKHNGDLDLIFDELRADPTKAKKPHHRPQNAKEFAERYLAGFYTFVADAEGDAESKSSHK